MLASAWRRLRSWRRIRFTRGGAAFTLGTLAVGFAAINTGNNLLYLLLGSLLGTIAVSGWLSERTLRGLRVSRTTPAGTTAGRPVRMTYTVTNEKDRLPTFSVILREEGLPGEAFVPVLESGETTTARGENVFVRRGVYPLEALTLSTSFPFGLFGKARDVELPGELVIWPRTDRSVREVAASGEAVRRPGSSSAGAPGARGEYRALRPYRPGDDPRDIHWRTTAHTGDPVIREYESDAAEARWLCLDLRSPPDEESEIAVEVIAALAARALRRGRRFALTTSAGTVPPGTGPRHLQRILDALARVDFREEAPAPVPPVDRSRCILVTCAPAPLPGFGDVITPGTETEEEAT